MRHVVLTCLMNKQPVVYWCFFTPEFTCALTMLTLCLYRITHVHFTIQFALLPLHVSMYVCIYDISALN